MITRIDLVRAYFYSSICTKQYEKARGYISYMTEAQFDLCVFSWQYVKTIMPDAYYDACMSFAYDGAVSIAREVESAL